MVSTGACGKGIKRFGGRWGFKVFCNNSCREKANRGPNPIPICYTSPAGKFFFFFSRSVLFLTNLPYWLGPFFGSWNKTNFFWAFPNILTPRGLFFGEATILCFLLFARSKTFLALGPIWHLRSQTPNFDDQKRNVRVIH